MATRSFAKYIVAAACLGASVFATAQDSAPQKGAALAKPAASAKPTCANPVGLWKNQMGSELKIQSVDATTGAVLGEYKTSSGAGGWHKLSGWKNTGSAQPGTDSAVVLSFAVQWGTVGSITSWTGFCRGADELRTVWNLARPVSQFEWDHVLTGADNFTAQ